ncbi:transmembrane protein 231 [Musca vetustissima]|uniref:transmembrane protein 231 n=1 Tax=Musca vetustissima TaxID=27455 RepID=UPI002AB62005|nr:transmembrane protein 231 [Musca vetustissima]
MKFIPLHTTNTAIVYKNAICSAATMLVLTFFALSVLIPLLMVSLLSPYSGIAESRILYEQPKVQFQFKSIFYGDIRMEDNNLIVCSTFPQLNNAINYKNNVDYCDGTKYWTEDLDYDGTLDRVHFTQQLETLEQKLLGFDIVLFFEASLKHKCELSPPAVLIKHITIPYDSQLASGVINIRADLVLKQYVEFTCPFPGRYVKTKFRHLNISSNSSSIKQFGVESLLDQLKSNPAFFELDIQETYFRRGPPADGLCIQLDIDILQLGARYHLSIWERLGQFWLYFASFFGISFYIMNKVKDFLFGRHIVRSWEIIPWKKLY